MELNEALARVDGPQTFLEFVRLLIADREKESGQFPDEFGRGVNGWENHTIEDFLEAATAWAVDSDFGGNGGSTEVSPWNLFAGFLYCGKIYE